MKNILHIFILFMLFFTTLEAIEFKDMYKISLKKDESVQFLVKYNNYIRTFKLRWTLYTNDGLVIFHSYDDKVAQNILYLNTKNQSFKVFLKEQGSGHYEVPYLLVKFIKFDFETHKVKFELFLSDKKSQIILEKVKKKS